MMDIKKIPESMPLEYLDPKVLKELKTEDWSGLAFQRKWSNQKLGKEIIKAGKLIYEKDWT
tara:strand:+ start:3485 stop:3667 length:183 start_codon:yes stop_codon:yes gene_type:complete